MRKDDRKKLLEMSAYSTVHKMFGMVDDLEEALEHFDNVDTYDLQTCHYRLAGYISIMRGELDMMLRHISSDLLGQRKTKMTNNEKSRGE